MRTLLSLCVGAALLVAASAVHAYPTLVGPTGAGNLPTAAVAPTGQLSIAADFHNTDDAGIDDSYPVRVLYGITRDWEIGGLYRFNRVAGSDANTWGVNAKYIVPVRLAGFTWSLGGLYSKTQRAALPLVATQDITGEQAYFVGDRTFALGGSTSFTGTIGVNWTRIDTGLVDANRFRLYGAGNLGLGSNLSVVADIQTKEAGLGDTDPLYSVALRYAPTSSISGQVGYSNATLNGLVSQSKGHLFAGLNFTFGGPSGATGTTTTTGY